MQRMKWREVFVYTGHYYDQAVAQIHPPMTQKTPSHPA
jgi:hypothetical protein